MTDELENANPSDDSDRRALPVDVDDTDPGVKAIIAPRLQSSRLVLRPPRVDDVDAIVAALNDIAIARMTSTIPHPYGEDDARAWIDLINRSWLARVSGTDAPSGGGFVIELKSNAPSEAGRVIGACGVRCKDDPEVMEIGYWIARAQWGHGYATEAAQTAIDWAFSAYNIRTIRALYRPINPASARVLVKCGFQPVGSELVHSITAGQVLVNTCKLQRPVWRALRRWGGSSPTLPTEVL